MNCFRWNGLLPAAVLLVVAGTAAAAPLDVPAIYHQALAISPAVRGAQQKLTEAQARVAEVSAQRRPQLSFSGSVSGSTGHVAEPPSDQSYMSVEGTVTLPLNNGRLLSATERQTAAQLRAAQAGLLRARLALALQASTAYYGLLRARSTQDISAENLAQAERQVDDTRKRVAAGDLPDAEILKAQVPAAAARVDKARADNAARLAEQTLNSLLGKPLSGALELVPDEELPAVAMTAAEAVALALRQSPDIQEAQANVDAARAGLAMAQRNHDPEWAVQATHARTSDVTAYSQLSTLMLTVTVPLTDGGVARQQVKQSRSQQEQAESALALARQQTELAAQQALLDVESALAARDGTRETVRIAQASLEKAQQAYAAGLTTTRDVLDAQFALAQARQQAGAAVYDLADARAKLDQILGKEPQP